MNHPSITATETQQHFARWLFTTVVLSIAACFSFLALYHAERWHPDEAFYMTIARNAAVNGDWWLISEPLDKPPLTYYLNALALRLFAIESDTAGVLQLDIYKGEFAGRLPALWMSIVLVAVGMRLAWALCKDGPRVYIVGLILALSPLRIVFAPTVFTDMPMLLLVTTALLFSIEGRPKLSALSFVLSLAAKPQSIFYLPLIVIFLLLAERPLRKVWHFMAIVVVCLALLAVWDAGRVAQGATSFYTLGQARYTPTTLTLLVIYPERLSELWATVRYTVGNGWLTIAALVIAAWQTARTRDGLAWLLGAWVAAFLGIHVILTLNLFDRNLLLLLPILALWFGRVYRLPQRKWMQLAFIGAIMLMAIVGWHAALGRYPIGGDDGRHRGIDDVANLLNDLPVATVIYDRWLDWQLDYYMGQWTDKRRVYYPTSAALVAGALALDEQGARYFVAPRRVTYDVWIDALVEGGFAPQLYAATDNFVIYALLPSSS